MYNSLIIMKSLPSSSVSATKPPPGLWSLFVTFFIIGIQSFGGGVSTFYLIHRVCIDRGWLDEETFLRDWALAQMVPGINLLKLTILVGIKLRGWSGLVAATTGLLFPSATATALMTAGFSAIRSQPLVQAALKGVLPATIGLSLSMAVQMGQPVLVRAYREGAVRFCTHILVLVCAALLMAVNFISPVVVLLLAGLVMVALLTFTPSKLKQRLEKDSQ
jgi:chromate transporter